MDTKIYFARRNRRRAFEALMTEFNSLAEYQTICRLVDPARGLLNPKSGFESRTADQNDAGMV